jgi:hypothetical protein
MHDGPHIALFRGRGLIGWHTRSIYSHAAWVVTASEDDAAVWEAWHLPFPRGGVRYLHSLAEGHRRGRIVDMYAIDGMTEARHATVTMAIAEHVGEPYDWLALCRFLTRRPHAENGRWFCSELIAEHVQEAGIWLMHVPPSHTTPAMLRQSPATHLVGTITVGTKQEA